LPEDYDARLFERTEPKRCEDLTERWIDDARGSRVFDEAM
jgi:hypothetical protein